MDSRKEYDPGYERRRAAFRRQYLKKKRQKRILHNGIVIAIRVVAILLTLFLAVKVTDILFSSVSRSFRTQGMNKSAVAKEDTSKPQSEETAKTTEPLLLVNSKNKLEETFMPQLVEVFPTIYVDKSAAEGLINMINATNAEGQSLYVASGYHTKERQKVLYEAKVKEYITKGSTKKEASKQAQNEIAPPDVSDYQTGLAVDIASDDDTIDISEFSKSSGYQWLLLHCKEYGFILRYPENKEDKTGMTFNPSHFRYVGKEAAEKIMEQGITLEEYVE